MPWDQRYNGFVFDIGFWGYNTFYGITGHREHEQRAEPLGYQKETKGRAPSNFLGSRLEIAREPGFVRLIRLSALIPEQVVQPCAVGLQLLATAAVHQREVQPSGSVSNSPDLVTDVRPRVLAHLPLEVGVGKQVEEVLGDFVVVTRSAQVSALAIDNLEGDTTCPGGDNGDASVEGLGDLDLETFTSGELKSDVGVVQECVQDCMSVEISVASRVLNIVDLRWSLGGILMTIISLEYSSYLVAIKWRTWS